MMKILIGSIICAFVLLFTQRKSNNMELDLIDAYTLNINQVKLFGEVNEQLSAFGLPEKLMCQNQIKQFESKYEVIEIIKESIDFTVVTYSAIEFWCFNDLESIPSKIDIRKLKNVISDSKISYNKYYSIDDFKRQYPNSYVNTPQMPTSFFEMATQEEETGLRHYLLQRATKSDKDARLMVEFTFKEDKLIYIFFANF